MGRIAGVAAAQTRERLLRAAADAFAERGYDGTRVADIAAAAGVSNGALYAHFASKADLLVAALHTHGRRGLADMFAADPDRSVTDLLLTIGQQLLRPSDARGSLVIEALAAARRDQDVAVPMRTYMAERADWLAGLIQVAQAAGELDPDLSADALAHLCLLLAMGGGLVTPDLHAVDDSAWAEVLTRVVAGLGPGRHKTVRSDAVKVRINSERCQGHGRCYDLMPDLFGDDDEGFGQVLGDGTVADGRERDARLAVANCPEHAIDLVGED